jgi:hypothetical protein
MTSFSEKAPAVVARLMADFDLTDLQAAGILGNLGHESSGLTAFQERHPVVPGSRGGWGWAQWTGPRRRAFEAYCAKTHQDPKSDAANYGYLWRELSGHEPGFDYRSAIDAVKKTDTLSEAVRAFEKAYEKASATAKAFPSRDRWAVRALDAFRAASGSKEVKRIQEKLVALGHELAVDGVVGPKTLAAIALALGV